jgi:hypothetical protein
MISTRVVPMIALYGINLQSEGDSRQRMVLCRNWLELLQRADAANAIVMTVSRLDEGWSARIRNLRRRAPLAQLVLVTDLTPENARQLGPLIVDRVVWSDEMKARWHEIPKMLTGSDREMERVYLALESSDCLEPRLRNALVLALEAEPAIRSVKRWAFLMEISTRGLEKLWRRHLPRGPSVGDLLRLLNATRGSEGCNRLVGLERSAARDLVDLIGIIRTRNVMTGGHSL